MNRKLLVIAVLMLAGCNKKPTETPAAPAQPGAAPKVAPSRVTHPALRPGPAPADVQALLTDEKVKGFVIYTREIASVASEAMGMAGAAFAKSKGDQNEMQRQMARDERTKKLAAASQAALAKAGLTQMEVNVLGRVLAEYYAKRMVAASAAEALAKAKASAKAGAKPGMLEEVYKKQAEEGQATRAEFEKKYGKAAVAIVDKHEKDFLEAQQAMLKAAFRRPAK